MPVGFNRRKMEDRRRDAAEKEAASRRATEALVLEDAERLNRSGSWQGRPRVTEFDLSQCRAVILRFVLDARFLNYAPTTAKLMAG